MDLRAVTLIAVCVAVTIVLRFLPFVEGFGQVKEYEVKLYSVDRNENVSAPVVQVITPLEANTNTVAATLTVRPGFRK